MATDIVVMAGVQEKVRERIQQAFMDLIPEDAWRGMVEAELQRFTQTSLTGMIQAAARERIAELLKAEFAKQDWVSQWGVGGEMASEMVHNILKECAPDLVAVLFGNLAQQIVNNIRNGALRVY